MSIASFKMFLGKRFPWLRRALHALDGRAIERLEGEIRALARAQSRGPGHPTLIARAMEDLSRPDRRAEFAWLGPAFHEDTGVARFSLECIRAAPVPIDYFASANEFGMSLAWSQRLANEGPHRLLPMDLAGYAAAIQSYRAILISIANSNHNSPALRALEQLDRFGAPAPVWLLMHDPLALNLVWRGASENPLVFASILRSAYGGEAVPERSLAEHDIPDLIERNILGLRALIRGKAIDRIIVNSHFAAQRVADDLSGLPAADRIVVGFHPIFPARRLHAPCTDGLRVGSFGVPGAAKRTEIVHDACAHLRDAGERVELILAGYETDSYLSSSPIAKSSWVSAFDSPSDAVLEDLMASVDVAVQLRRDPLGESSGVLAQLTAIGTPIIASDIGAFKDYAGAATLVAADISPKALAAIIRSRAASPIDASAFRRSHSTSAWWSLLLDMALAGRPRAVSKSNLSSLG